MNSRSALSVVEEKYGSLEDLALVILEEKHAALDETLPLAQRADAVGLPMLVFARVLQDPAFRQMLRADLVNKAYTLAEEESHIKHMVKVAVGEERKVVTNKGAIALVDPLPGDVINAGKYLNELRGTPVEGKRDSAFRGVIVNFENMQVNIGADPGPVTLEAHVHTPRRAGELPPAAVPLGGAPAGVERALPLPGAAGGLGAFYGEGAKEQDAALPLAGTEARREEGEAQESPAKQFLKHRGLWPGRTQQHRRRVMDATSQRPPYED